MTIFNINNYKIVPHRTPFYEKDTALQILNIGKCNDFNRVDMLLSYVLDTCCVV